MKESYDFSDARRGAVIEDSGKTRVTLFLDDDVLAGFRERARQQGKGYETLINDALRAALSPDSAPLTEETLRRVLREELQAE